MTSPVLSARRPLGWTKVPVAPLAMGTMQLGWTVSDVASMELLDHYVDAGGNLIDTADMYGPNQNWRSYDRCKPHLGVSEDIIGRWSQSRRNRDELVVTTKVRAPMWDGPHGQGLSRQHILRAAEDSLRRLRTDRIDLYLAHWPDDKVPLEETFEAFAALIAAGKVRFVGTSNYAALGQLETAISLNELGYPKIAAEQLRYNLLNRAEYEGDAQHVLAAHIIATMCYSPLASGFLTGKYSRHSMSAGERSKYVAQYMEQSGWRLIDRLSELSADRNVSVAAISLAWLLAHPNVTTAVVGANSVEQLTQLLAGAAVTLTPTEIAELGSLGWPASKVEYAS